MQRLVNIARGPSHTEHRGARPLVPSYGATRQLPEVHSITCVDSGICELAPLATAPSLRDSPNCDQMPVLFGNNACAICSISAGNRSRLGAHVCRADRSLASRTSRSRSSLLDVEDGSRAMNATDEGGSETLSAVVWGS